ncbi:ferritin family protein [Calditerrivibrio sp.]|uniref:ferritin family protein n=1 Tax=Calditerrivibrio sp. TaxID=2792612 RepID=UPI003D0CDDD3
MAGLNDMNKQEKIKAIEEMIQIVLLRIPKEIEAMHFYIKAAEKSTTDERKISLSLLPNRKKGMRRS